MPKQKSGGIVEGTVIMDLGSKLQFNSSVVASPTSYDIKVSSNPGIMTISKVGGSSLVEIDNAVGTSIHSTLLIDNNVYVGGNVMATTDATFGFFDSLDIAKNGEFNAGPLIVGNIFGGNYYGVQSKVSSTSIGGPALILGGPANFHAYLIAETGGNVHLRPNNSTGLQTILGSDGNISVPNVTQVGIVWPAATTTLASYTGYLTVATSSWSNYAPLLVKDDTHAQSATTRTYVNSHPHTQSGTFSVGVVGAGVVTGNHGIAFSPAFTSAPAVVCIAGNARLVPSTASVTTTGANIIFANWSPAATAGASTAHWVAVGPVA